MTLSLTRRRVLALLAGVTAAGIALPEPRRYWFGWRPGESALGYVDRLDHGRWTVSLPMNRQWAVSQWQIPMRRAPILYGQSGGIYLDGQGRIESTVEWGSVGQASAAFPDGLYPAQIKLLDGDPEEIARLMTVSFSGPGQAAGPPARPGDIVRERTIEIGPGGVHRWVK